MIKKLLIFLLISLLLADIGYSFLQNYHITFDGDMAGGIVPVDNVELILESPLGLKIFREHVTYPNPNKYFCHWSFYKYFNTFPLFFQNFTSPINSAYLSCAFAKTIIQVILIFLLAFFVSGKIFKLDFLFAAILITPLFQTNGYCRQMGIIDPATTYTFFYALPTILILIYFAPLFLKYFHGIELKILKYIKYLWLPLALVSCLSGALNPGISLVLSLVIFIYYFSENAAKAKNKNIFSRLKFVLQNIPRDDYFYLIPVTIISIYSLYLGQFNSINLSNKMPLSFLYLRLVKGLYHSFFQKLGFPVLFFILTINTLIIYYKFRTPEAKKILNTFKWIGFFALIYILLLPLGGYRNYRPYILRYDTIIPITLSLMFIFAKTTLFILKNFSQKYKYQYILLPILVLFVYTISDKPEFNKNTCQRNAILQIAGSKDKIVEIGTNCTVLSWRIIENPKESELNIKLLQKWRIINNDKLYYQKSKIAKDQFRTQL